jgi:pyruvate kinase
MSQEKVRRISESPQVAAARHALEQIHALRQAALALEAHFAEPIAAVTPALQPSARNLVHYLAVRSHDIRELQADLARLGLSSLGRMEAHAMASLDLVVDMLCLILGQQAGAKHHMPAPDVDIDSGNAKLARNATAILGPADADRDTRIMVTMPGEAAENPALIRDLLARGMQVMRINCAHDNPLAWARMVLHLRRAERRLGRQCKVSFDLAGPKLRTGQVEPAPGVIKWRPQRDSYGRVVAPAVINFTSSMTAFEAAQWTVPLIGALSRDARTGDTVKLVDARGRKRRLAVVAVSGRACVCHANRTAYVTSGIKVRVRRGRKVIAKATIAELPARRQKIMLKPGDMLNLTRNSDLGRPALVDSAGKVIAPATIGCDVPEVFGQVKAGQRVFFDDGRFEGLIRQADAERMLVEMTSVTGGAGKLGAEKGINLPDSELGLSALTVQDKEALDFVVRHADMVAISFVQNAVDIQDLISELHRRNASELGIVVKIETQRAFNRLPHLLLAAMRHPLVAVMVARGDLGVEVGFERLSEVQEEILWLCEAAHIPVIWATQVLESLAKNGLSSRAEVTDAAMSGRAECVMLNKGPFFLDALSFLGAVLHRMQAHQVKKTATLRRLQVSNIQR